MYVCMYVCVYGTEAKFAKSCNTLMPTGCSVWHFWSGSNTQPVFLKGLTGPAPSMVTADLHGGPLMFLVVVCVLLTPGTL